MTRFKLALIIVGGVLVFFGIQEMRLSSGCKAEPKKLTCAELSANGPGDNSHIQLTDFVLPESVFVYNESSKGGGWTCIWIPAVPLDGDYVKEYQKAMEAGGQPPAPTGLKVIVKSKGVRTEKDLEALAKKDMIQGVVINKVEAVSGEEKKILVQNYPGSNIDTCWILEVGRTPSGMGKLAGFFGGGIVCAGLGVVLMLAKK